MKKKKFGKAPAVGKTNIYDPHMDKTYQSFREMEKDAEANGKAVVSAKDFDKRKILTQEERLSRGDARLDAAIERAQYRLRHGYKD